MARRSCSERGVAMSKDWRRPSTARWDGTLESFGGVLLVLGLWTRPVAALFCGFMFVAALQFNTQAWWWTQSGREMPLLLLGIALVILLRGGGPYSLDRKIGREF